MSDIGQIIFTRSGTVSCTPKFHIAPWHAQNITVLTLHWGKSCLSFPRYYARPWHPNRLFIEMKQECSKQSWQVRESHQFNQVREVLKQKNGLRISSHQTWRSASKSPLQKGGRKPFSTAALQFCENLGCWAYSIWPCLFLWDGLMQLLKGEQFKTCRFKACFLGNIGGGGEGGKSSVPALKCCQLSMNPPVGLLLCLYQQLDLQKVAGRAYQSLEINVITC